MYKKCLSSCISSLQVFDSHRICGIEVHTNVCTSLFIFCVYSPADDNVDYYNSVLKGARTQKIGLKSTYLKN